MNNNLSVDEYRKMLKRGNDRHPLRMETDQSEIRLELSVPPSVNKLTANKKNGGRCKTAVYRDWCKVVSAEIMVQKPGSISGWVDIEFHFPRRRNKDGSISKVKRDASNLIKASEDTLVNNGVIEDDSLVWRGLYGWQTVNDKVIIFVRRAKINEELMA